MVSIPKKTQTSRATRIRIFVVIGYLVLCLISLFGVLNIYSEFRAFTKDTPPQEEREELTLVSNILASLYEAENIRSALHLGDKQQYGRLLYDSVRLDIHVQIDSLYKISSDTLVRLSLDSVSTLLNLKYDNAVELFQLVDSINSIPLREKTFTTVLSKNDIDGLNKIYSRHMQDQKDSTIIQVKKKSFRERLSDVFRPTVKDSLLVSSNQNSVLLDSLLPAAALVDTVTQYLTDVLLVQQNARNRFVRKLTERQYQLIGTNERITQQIRFILYEIEARAYSKNVQYLVKKEVALSRSSRIAFGVAIAAFVTAILFLGLSLRIVTKEQRYQAQLKNAKKYAEDLLHVRERLMLAISHDIKAPLSSIISYLELLSRSKLSDREQYYLENVQKSSEHMLELVTQLLDYHRLESGKQDVRKMFFSPHRLINDLYLSFVPLIKQKKLHFEFVNRLDANAFYQSDPVGIRQILNNMLSNAVKFTDSGTVTLIAILDTTDSATNLVVLVKDTGCGIEKEELEFVFEEFSRTEYSEENGVEGSGLGLAIVKKIVTLLNGDIQVTSEKGIGSEFTVIIPLEQGRDTGKKNLIGGEVQKLEILFIDDDPVLLKMYTDLLKHEGYSPMVCPNSLEALNILQEKSFDIIFSDIQMPGMNGFELVEKIRNSAIPALKEVPVIALSARSDISEQHLKESGFSGFLSKPFSFDQLYDIIVRHSNISYVPLSKKISYEGFDALTAVADKDVVAARQIVETFIKENLMLMEKMKASLKVDDWNPIKASAHRLRPLMRMIGKEETVTILDALENGSRDPKLLDELLQKMETINREAERYIAEKYPY